MSRTGVDPVAGRRRRALGATAVAIGAIVAASCVARFGLDARSLVGVPFVCVLVTLAAIDLETRLLPNRIVLSATVAALLAQIALFPDRTLEWIAASLVVLCSCSFLHWSRPDLSAWGT